MWRAIFDVAEDFEDLNLTLSFLLVFVYVSQHLQKDVANFLRL
jgi:hypothetical protein